MLRNTLPTSWMGLHLSGPGQYKVYRPSQHSQHSRHPPAPPPVNITLLWLCNRRNPARSSNTYKVEQKSRGPVGTWLPTWAWSAALQWTYDWTRGVNKGKATARKPLSSNHNRSRVAGYKVKFKFDKSLPGTSYKVVWKLQINNSSTSYTFNAYLET